MDLDCTGAPQHCNDLTGGISPHDRVVDNHDSVAVDHLAQGIQLHFYALLAHGLRRLYERATHVSVLNEALAVGNPRGLSEALGGRNAAVRDGYHQVGVRTGLLGEATAHAETGGIDILTHEVRIRSGEIDVFEHACSPSRGGEALPRHPVHANGDQLAGFHVADEL